MYPAYRRAAARLYHAADFIHYIFIMWQYRDNPTYRHPHGGTYIICIISVDGGIVVATGGCKS